MSKDKMNKKRRISALTALAVAFVVIASALAAGILTDKESYVVGEAIVISINPQSIEDTNSVC